MQPVSVELDDSPNVSLMNFFVRPAAANRHPSLDAVAHVKGVFVVALEVAPFLEDLWKNRE